MKINVTDTSITLESDDTFFSLLEKPEFPSYSNLTARPHFTTYYVMGDTIWNHFSFCMERLSDLCPNDPYLGCYALMFRRLYSFLLSSSQANNIIAYGPSLDCGAYSVFQDFMSFLHEGSALTALAQSSFSFTTLAENSCSALLYRLDACPAITAVCDAMGKIKSGGLILLYTLQDSLPAELLPLCEKVEKDRFDTCTVYALTMDESLSDFAHTNSSVSLLLSRVQKILKRVNDVRNPIQAMLVGAGLPMDAYSLVALVLQQTEEILLSIYDYLEDAELPIRANALKEAVLNYYAGICGNSDLATYKEKLTQSSEIFFAAIEREFR